MVAGERPVALGVDLEQDGHAVTGALGDLGVAGCPPLSHVETHACRRSYTRPASGEAASAGCSAGLSPTLAGR